MLTKLGDVTKIYCGPFPNFDGSLTDFDSTSSNPSSRSSLNPIDDNEISQIHQIPTFRGTQKRPFAFDLTLLSLYLIRAIEIQLNVIQSSVQSQRASQNQGRELSRPQLESHRYERICSNSLRVPNCWTIPLRLPKRLLSSYIKSLLR